VIFGNTSACISRASWEHGCVCVCVCVCVQVWSKGKPELSSAQRPLPPQSAPRRDAHEHEQERTRGLSLYSHCAFPSLTRRFNFCRDESVGFPAPAPADEPQVQLQARPHRDGLQFTAGRRTLHEWKRIPVRVQRRRIRAADLHTLLLQELPGRRRRRRRRGDTEVSVHSSYALFINKVEVYDLK